MKKITKLALAVSSVAVVGVISAFVAIAQTGIDTFYTPKKYPGTTLNVVVSASHLGEPYGPMYRQLASGFEKASGAKVNLVPVSESDMYNKVRLSLIAGQCTYDAMETGAGGAKDYGMSGFLAALPTPPDVSNFFKGDVNQYSIDGKLFGMPMYSDTNLIFWRTDLFKAAGLPDRPPRTYTEFTQWAIRLTEDTNGKHPGEAGFDPNSIAIYGSVYKGNTLASTWEWYNYLFAFGSDVFDSKWNITVNDARAVNSLKWLTDNYRVAKIYPADTLTYNYSEFHTLFAQGKVAMAINWPYMWSILQNPAQSKVVGKVAVGRKPAQVKRGGNIGGWSFNVFEKCPNKAAAIDLAKWMASPAASEAYSKASLVPVRKSVLAAKAKSEGQPWVAISENMPDGRMVTPIGTGESWMPIEEVLQIAIQESMTGKSTPKAALDKAAAGIKTILDKNGFYKNMPK